MSHPVLVSIFLALAVTVVGAGCVGMVIMRSAAARLHFVSATALVAPPLVMAAMLCEEGLSQAGLKAVLIFLVLFIQSPVVTHVLGRAIHAYERLPASAESKESP